MPKFGSDVTSMSAIDGKSIFKMNVQEGVVDKSAAMHTAATTGLIGDAANLGLEVYKTSAMADYEKGLLAQVDKYNAPKETAAADMERIGLEKGASLFAKDRGFDPLLEKPLEALGEAYASATKKYEAAKAQGVITPEQFRDNILNETRKAVAANPGLYDEYRQHAAKVLGLSGIEATIKSDEEAAKAKAAAKKTWDDAINKDAIQYGVQQHDPLKEQKVLGLNRKKTIFQNFLDETKYNDAQRGEVVRNPQMMLEVFDGAATGLTTLYSQIQNDPALSTTDKLKAFEERYSTGKRKTITSFGISANDPAVAANIKIMDDQAQVYRDVLSGKTSTEAAKNLVEFNTARATNNLNAYDAQVLLPFFNAFDPASKLLMQQDGLFNPLKKVINGETVKDLDWSTPQTPKMMSQVSSVAIEQAKVDPTNLGKVFQSYHNTIFDTTIPEKDRTKVISNFVASMGAKGANEGISKIAVEVRSQLASDTKVYLGQVASAIGTATVFPDNTTLNRPKDLRVSLMGDSLVFSSTLDPATADKLTTVYGKEINNTIHTLANIYGHGDVRKMIADKETDMIQVLQTMSGGELRSSAGVLTTAKPTRRESDIQIPPDIQKARDDKGLQILYQEREDQKSLGKLDPQLEKEISIRENRLGVK